MATLRSVGFFCRFAQIHVICLFCKYGFLCERLPIFCNSRKNVISCMFCDPKHLFSVSCLLLFDLTAVIGALNSAQVAYMQFVA